MNRKSDLANVGRGFLMGGADIVPGVSGGTVALIVGIYERLVTAISRFDAAFLGFVKRRQWSAAASHVDLRFLAALGLGIVLGIGGLASLMHYLLEDQEHISIQSICTDQRQVILNVGVSHGGVQPGTVLSVQRREKADSVAAYRHVGNLRLERYSDSAEGRATVRAAVATRIDDGTGPITSGDVVTHPSSRRPPTLGLFFGLILASSLLVGQMVKHWTAATYGGLAAAALFAFWLVGLLPAVPPQGLWYMFLTGVLAICAMILPGISGAFIMLLMGKYTEITGIVRDFARARILPEALLTGGVFAAGAVSGILSFSRLLRWLLSHHQAITMSVLCGFMLGSLRKIWPFKADLTPEATEFKLKQFANIWPPQFDATTWLTLVMILTGLAAVLLLHILSNRWRETGAR